MNFLSISVYTCKLQTPKTPKNYENRKVSLQIILFTKNKIVFEPIFSLKCIVECTERKYFYIYLKLCILYYLHTLITSGCPSL